MSAGTIRDAIDRHTSPHRGRIPFVRLPNLELLTIALVAGSALAISPVGREIDRLFFVKVITRADGATFTFFSDVLDRLSSQRVVGVLLVVVAVLLATHRRSLTPLIVAGLAELMFLSVGILKIGFAKSATKLGDPQWWDGGLLAYGKYSMAYPSGHATESVVLWGAIVLLLALYAPSWRPQHTRIAVGVWQLVMVNTIVVSWLLGRHWVSDLAAGLLCGLIGLRLVVGLLERGYPQAVDQAVRAGIRTAIGPAIAAPQPRLSPINQRTHPAQPQHDFRWDR